MEDELKHKSWWERWVGSGKNEELKQLLEEQDSRLLNLEDALSRSRLSSEAFEQECTILEERLSSALEESEKYKRKWVESEQQRLNWQSRFHKQSAELESSHEERSNLREETNLCKKQHTQLETELASLKSTCDEWQQKARSHYKRIKHLEEETKRTAALEDELNTEQRRLEELEKANEELTLLLTNTTSTLQSESEKRSALEKSLKRKQSDWQTTKTTLEEQLQEQKLRFDTLQSENSAQSSLLLRTQAALVAKEEELNSTLSNVESLQAKERSLKTSAQAKDTLWRRAWSSLSESLLTAVGPQALSLWKLHSSSAPETQVEGEIAEEGLLGFLQALQQQEWIRSFEYAPEEAAVLTIQLQHNVFGEEEFSYQSVMKYPWLVFVLKHLEEVTNSTSPLHLQYQKEGSCLTFNTLAAPQT
jgi:DNA repair exonuclease SbcCD ATPase subunit